MTDNSLFEAGRCDPPLQSVTNSEDCYKPVPEPVLEKFKLFWKAGPSQKQIEYISYPDGQEYYSFVKDHYDKGYRQIIISSKIMVELLKTFVLEENYIVAGIQFAEDDSDFNNKIRSVLS